HVQHDAGIVCMNFAGELRVPKQTEAELRHAPRFLEVGCAEAASAQREPLVLLRPAVLAREPRNHAAPATRRALRIAELHRASCSSCCARPCMNARPGMPRLATSSASTAWPSAAGRAARRSSAPAASNAYTRSTGSAGSRKRVTWSLKGQRRNVTR